MKLTAGIIACAICSLAFAMGEDGSCDPNVERVTKTIRLRAGTISEDSENLRGMKVCEKTELRIKKCAVIEHRKPESQYFCYPEDGSEQHAEHYEIIEYYEGKSQ